VGTIVEMGRLSWGLPPVKPVQKLRCFGTLKKGSRMEDSELIARYLSGEVLGSIAAAANCEVTCICNRLNRLLPMIGHRQEPTNIANPRQHLAVVRRKLVVKLRKEGVSTAEIAKRTGYSEGYVNQIAPPVNRNYDLLIQDIESQLVERADERGTSTNCKTCVCVVG
jgi:hypothetical protein